MTKPVVRLGVVFVALVLGASASAEPTRWAGNARSALNPGTKWEWIIKPSEEKRGDQTVRNAPETDIRAVVAANGPQRLRIDIQLWNPINFGRQVVYAFVIRYRGGVKDVFGYFPHNKRFMLLSYAPGKKVKRQNLRRGKDMAVIGRTRIGGRWVKNTRVTLYIDKARHFSSRPGERKQVIATFLSGFVSVRTGRLKVADSTRTVTLGYVR